MTHALKFISEEEAECSCGKWHMLTVAYTDINGKGPAHRIKQEHRKHLKYTKQEATP